MSITLTYTQARARLAELLDEVSLNKEVVIIKRKKAENVALISESELSSFTRNGTPFTLPAKFKTITQRSS